MYGGAVLGRDICIFKAALIFDMANSRSVTGRKTYSGQFLGVSSFLRKILKLVSNTFTSIIILMEKFELEARVLARAIPLLRTYEQCYELLERYDTFLQLAAEFRRGNSNRRLRILILRLRELRISVYFKMMERAEKDEREP